jgi:hypothetical protein
MSSLLAATASVGDLALLYVQFELLMLGGKKRLKHVQH